MPLSAFCLVIVAAFSHATWNLFAKRAAFSRHFIWFYSSGSVIIFAPVLAWALVRHPPEWSRATFLCLIATAVLHILYSESLQRGYKAADLSVVYPLARGTGPLLSFFGAVILLGESPSFLSCTSALMVITGVFLIAGGTNILRAGRSRTGLYWGVLTGLFIAAYTLNDGYAVKVLALSPILVDFTGNLFRSIMLAPKAWRDRARLGAEYRAAWKLALGVSILGPGGYILILYAMRIAPVSHVAPARELSMMVGSYFGVKLLKEGHMIERLFASALIIGGVVGLALA